MTGDGLLALARRVETPAAPPYPLLLPGVARVPGANGTLWRTGLRLVNPGLGPGRGDARGPRRKRPRVARSCRRAAPSRSPTSSARSDIRKGARRRSGSPRRRASRSSPRPGTSTPRAARGRSPPRRSRLPRTPSRARAGSSSFTGLSADSGSSGFRTNVAFVGGPGGARGRLLLRAASGEPLAEAGLEAGPSSWTQRSLAEWLGGVAVPRDATLEVTVDSGSLDAYASVIDNGTGDPVILAPASPAVGLVPAGRSRRRSSRRPRPGSRRGLPSSCASRPRGAATGRVVPGDLPLGPGGSLSVVPAVTTTYRWISSVPCSEDRSAPVTVEVVAPARRRPDGGGSRLRDRQRRQHVVPRDPVRGSAGGRAPLAPTGAPGAVERGAVRERLRAPSARSSTMPGTSRARRTASPSTSGLPRRLPPRLFRSSSSSTAAETPRERARTRTTTARPSPRRGAPSSSPSTTGSPRSAGSRSRSSPPRRAAASRGTTGRTTSSPRSAG